MRIARFLGLAATLVLGTFGCGSDDDTGGSPSTSSTTGSGAAGGSGGAAAGGGGAGGEAPMTLTSSAFTEGGAFPDKYSCAGANTSPPLDWTAGPSATKSYAIVLADESFNHFQHWVIWDIPPDVLALAENVPKVATPPMPSGAKQTKSYDDQTFGYLGPCPGGEEHTYQFVAYALDIDVVPDVTTSSKMADVETAVLAHDIASASLSAKSSAQ